MGCCESTDSSTNQFDEKIKDFVQYGNVSGLSTLYKMMKHKNQKVNINTLEFKVDENLTVNLLGYSLLLGQSPIFSLVLQEMQGDFEKMEASFENALNENSER